MPRKKKTSLEIEIASIPDGGYHCFMEILVNNHHCRMLIDTGASRTIFNLSFMQEIMGEEELSPNEVLATGLGSDQIQNYVAIVNELIIGDLLINDFHAGLLDISIVNQTYDKLNVPLIHGVIGSDLLVEYNAVIDFKKRILSLSY
jgi:predicted aspartyl protease